MKNIVRNLALITIASCLCGNLAMAQAPAAGAPAVKVKPRGFEYSNLQIHAFPDFNPYHKNIFKLMFDRISQYQYGDDYFFLGVNSDYTKDWSSNTETLYFKYAANLSYNKIYDSNTRILPFIRDTLLSVQVNSGDLEYLRTVWLGGIAFDIAGLPNYGFLRLYMLARQEEANDATHQVTLIWAQPFSTGKLKWVFNGWGAHWSSDDSDDVIKIEPQLRLRLASFVNEGNIFYNGVIGSELEMGYHYLADPETHEILDWVVNPSVFYAIPF